LKLKYFQYQVIKIAFVFVKNPVPVVTHTNYRSKTLNLNK